MEMTRCVSPSSPPLEVRTLSRLGLGAGSLLSLVPFPRQVLSTWTESLHHRGDTLLAPDFTAQACATAVSERSENEGPRLRPCQEGGSRNSRGSSAVPGWRGDAQRVSDLGADPATGQLAARACLPGLTWRPGSGEGRGRREGAA